MTLQTIYHSRLQNMEHYQFASRVLQLCNEAKVEKLTAVLGPLAACVADEDRVLNQPRTGADTKALEEADLRTADLLRHVARIQAQVYVNLLDADNRAFDTLFHARVKSGAPAGSFDIKPLRAATDKALNAVLRRIDALDELEPSAPITALITQYNNLVDNRRTLLAGRAATNKAHADKHVEELRKELDPLIRKFEEENGIAPNVLAFTGKTQGSGKKKLYELAYSTDPKRTLWVQKNKEGALQEVKE